MPTLTIDGVEIEVEAGQSVLVVFENNDTMTHNLIVTVPGAHEEVGAAAEFLKPVFSDDGIKFQLHEGLFILQKGESHDPNL